MVYAVEHVMRVAVKYQTNSLLNIRFSIRNIVTIQSSTWHLVTQTFWATCFTYTCISTEALKWNSACWTFLKFCSTVSGYEERQNGIGQYIGTMFVHLLGSYYFYMFGRICFQIWISSVWPRGRTAQIISMAAILVQACTIEKDNTDVL